MRRGPQWSVLVAQRARVGCVHPDRGPVFTVRVGHAVQGGYQVVDVLHGHHRGLGRNREVPHGCPVRGDRLDVVAAAELLVRGEPRGVDPTQAVPREHHGVPRADARVLQCLHRHALGLRELSEGVRGGRGHALADAFDVVHSGTVRPLLGPGENHRVRGAPVRTGGLLHHHRAVLHGFAIRVRARHHGLGVLERRGRPRHGGGDGAVVAHTGGQRPAGQRRHVVLAGAARRDAGEHLPPGGVQGMVLLQVPNRSPENRPGAFRRVQPTAFAIQRVHTGRPGHSHRHRGHGHLQFRDVRAVRGRRFLSRGSARHPATRGGEPLHQDVPQLLADRRAPPRGRRRGARSRAGRPLGRAVLRRAPGTGRGAVGPRQLETPVQEVVHTGTSDHGVRAAGTPTAHEDPEQGEMDPVPERLGAVDPGAGEGHLEILDRACHVPQERHSRSRPGCLQLLGCEGPGDNLLGRLVALRGRLELPGRQRDLGRVVQQTRHEQSRHHCRITQQGFSGQGPQLRLDRERRETGRHLPALRRHA